MKKGLKCIYQRHHDATMPPPRRHYAATIGATTKVQSHHDATIRVISLNFYHLII